jgi:response regulator RpfG family c-di-GMP phosphodiesterase
MEPKILFVDDDANILAGFRRQLRGKYPVDTAEGPESGLEKVTHGDTYGVIISDFKMPGMDGIQFLSRAREIAPDTVRIMLTGYAELQTAMDAVNEGNIFRFLTKPVEPEVLEKALEMGLAQYRLIRAEKELLEETLRGSIKVLTQILSLLNPEAFGRASRITRYVREIAIFIKAPEAWQLETAAMLSQIGCILLPEGALKKLSQGQPLTPEEVQLFDMHPFIASDLLKNIPRMEEIAETISYQEKHFDGAGNPQDDRQGENLPLGARILKVVLDFDSLETAGAPKTDARAQLKTRTGWYDPAILAALKEVIRQEAQHEVRTIPWRELKDNMILDNSILTAKGTILITKGQEVNQLMRKRLKAFAETIGIREPIRVLVPLEK